MSQESHSNVNERIKRNIESIAQLEQEFERRRTAADRLSDAVSAFAGSARFIAANALLISAWLLWNLVGPPGVRFDPTLGGLQLIIAVETLLLSAFVLMSQNRQSRQTDHWAHVDLQLSLLAEQETTKVLQMMQTVFRRLGMEKTAGDQELKQMAEPVPVASLVAEVGKARQAEETGLLEVAAVLAEETRAGKKPPDPPAQDSEPPRRQDRQEEK